MVETEGGGEGVEGEESRAGGVVASAQLPPPIGDEDEGDVVLARIPVGC